jgi:predicted helicase
MEQIERTVAAFNVQVEGFRPVLAAHMSAGTEAKKRLVQNFIDLDPKRISWTLSLKNRLAALRDLAAVPSQVVVATYRPFFRQFAYFDPGLNHIRGQSPRFFPTPDHANFGFVVTGVSSHAPFGLLMVDALPDLHVLDTGQFFARWRYEEVHDSGMLDLGVSEGLGGYRRIDNVTDESLAAFRAAYPQRKFTTDDVFFYTYGLLHSPEYRLTYAADLKKTLPRLPLVRDPEPFISAGRALSETHLGYETARPYPLAGLHKRATGDPFAFFRTERLAYGKRRSGGKSVDDKSTVVYNTNVTLQGIPDEAYRFMLGTRSAVDWVIEKFRVSTDKNSGIVNDPNDWSREVGDPRYILDLLARVVTVSVETMKIVDALPPLDIMPTG